MALNITVLTLNIWGIPYISKDKEIRVEAIANQLKAGNYDLVSLQEVWAERDYQNIKNKVQSVLPYHHYFYSGVFGSGLCVFSKHPIKKVFYHSWRLNGYVHRIQHGDWFGGKGVGLVQVKIETQLVNFYVAHLHAEYDRVSDDYLTHRIIQAFDTAQFIESTRGDATLQILAGDLNTEPGDQAYRIITSTSGLRDLYDQAALKGTNECSKNTYSSESEVARCPNGKRIDYVMVRPSEQFKLNSVEYSQPFPERIPGHDCSFSDHEAVQAVIRTTRVTSREDEQNVQEMLDSQEEDSKVTLSECIKVCDHSLEQLLSHRKSYIMAAIAIMVVLFNLIELQAPYGFKTVFLAVKLVLAATVLFLLFMASIWNATEKHAVLSARLSMEILLRGIEKV